MQKASERHKLTSDNNIIIKFKKPVHDPFKRSFTPKYVCYLTPIALQGLSDQLNLVYCPSPGCPVVYSRWMVI